MTDQDSKQNDNSQDVSSETAAEEQNAAGETSTAQQQAEVIDWKAKYFYLAAEMENARKRMEREKENLLKYGTEKILGDIVDVIDNFERTVDMLKFDEDQKVKNIVIGLEMVRKLFIDGMNKHGLSPLDSMGKDFDPNFHEAMGQEYFEGKRPNEIVKEYQRGYILNGRLLRAAKVVIASDKQ